MDIAAMSVNMASAQLLQSVGLAMAKKTMDMAQQQGAALQQMMAPPSNHILDVRA
ncbi:MAG: putative motility protein [Oscillospiraceae bacterium]